MNTNKYLQLSLFLCCIALMASCSDPVKSRMGGYSYQIAKQEVTIDDTLSIVLTGEIRSDTATPVSATANNWSARTY